MLAPFSVCSWPEVVWSFHSGIFSCKACPTTVGTFTSAQMSIKSFCPQNRVPPPPQSANFEGFSTDLYSFSSFWALFAGGGGGKTKFCGQEFYGHPDFSDTFTIMNAYFRFEQWFALWMIWDFRGPGFRTSRQSSVCPSTLLRCLEK